MTMEKSSFISSNGVTPVSYLLYLPDGSIRGVVQLVHGMCEHKERYERFMSYLAGEGFACCIHDHLGHGETAETPEELGYFGERSGWRYLVEDTVRLCSLIQSREELRGKPYFLFGHSMGSFVARLATIELEGKLAGAIYCGTGGERRESAAGKALVEHIIRTKGPRIRPKVVDQMMFGGYNRHFGTAYTGKEWLSRNLAVGQAYIRDPLCNFRFTAAAFGDLLRLNMESNTPGWFAAMDHQLPVLLIAGDADPVGQYGKGVAQVARRLRGSGSEDVSLRLYSGARHEILNELNFKEVQGDILCWMESHLPQNG